MRQKKSPESLDLLPTPTRGEDFVRQVKSLRLSEEFTKKILAEHRVRQALTSQEPSPVLSPEEENELATEALLLRHRFTSQVCLVRSFRQAAISIIQNIYLFANRRIFFQAGTSAEGERQAALLMLTAASPPQVPLARSFQHPVIARIWQRVCLLSAEDHQEKGFAALMEIVGQLNTIRNIYILFSMGLIRQLVRQTPPLYMQGITAEDAIQIGSFGIARAAYRFHPASGVRFSTFSARWVRKEIQRQALKGRLIPVSSYIVGQFCKEQQTPQNEPGKKRSYSDILNSSAPLPLDEQTPEPCGDKGEAAELYEQKELWQLISDFLKTRLPEKTADVIRRRYGLPPYQGQSQSIIAIARHYQVSRGSIYQLEKSGLDKLRHHLAARARR